MSKFRSHRFFAWLFDRFAPEVEEKGFEAYRRELVSKLEGSVLEVGAGTGINLGKYEEAEWVVALEPDRHMRSRLLPVARAARKPVSVVSALAYPLPFADSTFDNVVFCLVLCSVPDQSAALEEARRVLKPSGKVHFLEHVRADSPKLARRQDLIQPIWSFFGAGCHPNRDTAAAIERAGFRLEVRRFDFDVGSFSVIARPHIIGTAALPHSQSL